MYKYNFTDMMDRYLFVTASSVPKTLVVMDYKKYFDTDTPEGLLDVNRLAKVYKKYKPEEVVLISKDLVLGYLKSYTTANMLYSRVYSFQSTSDFNTTSSIVTYCKKLRCTSITDSLVS